jgi:hypothetical protein
LHAKAYQRRLAVIAVIGKPAAALLTGLCKVLDDVAVLHATYFVGR